MQQAVKIKVYRWAGEWGPFKIKIPCGECALTGDVILDVADNELSGVPVEVETIPWLNKWWQPLLKRAWHAPIVMVEGKVISQGEALNRGVLTQEVVNKWVGGSTLKGTHVFAKDGCPHCVRAKGILDKAGIAYETHDVVRSPRAMYEMLSRVKPLVGKKTPITVPQVWIDGVYVGGADAVEAKYGGTSKPSAKSPEPSAKSPEPSAKPAEPSAKPAEPVAESKEPSAKPEPSAESTKPVAESKEPAAEASAAKPAAAKKKPAAKRKAPAKKAATGSTKS